jgi:hypothetical protein
LQKTLKNLDDGTTLLKRLIFMISAQRSDGVISSIGITFSQYGYLFTPANY